MTLPKPSDYSGQVDRVLGELCECTVQSRDFLDDTAEQPSNPQLW